MFDKVYYKFVSITKVCKSRINTGLYDDFLTMQGIFFNYIFKLYYTSLKKGKEIKVWLLNERKKKLLQPTLMFLF